MFAHSLLLLLLVQYPIVRLLTVVIKMLLFQHSLHQPYTGGLGSYGTFLLAFSHVRVCDDGNHLCNRFLFLRLLHHFVLFCCVFFVFVVQSYFRQQPEATTIPCHPGSWCQFVALPFAGSLLDLQWTLNCLIVCCCLLLCSCRFASLQPFTRKITSYFSWIFWSEV
jgi:hypothetical protein